ncbi:MAG: hypothetical protein Q7R85_03710 [bacterium]|nr:hypothetical protein [bacterium]
MRSRTEVIDPEELCEDVEGIDEMSDDDKETAMKQRLNEKIEAWNKNGLFVTFTGGSPPPGKISFCLATAAIKTPQRLIVCRLLTAEEVAAIDADKRDGFLAYLEHVEVGKIEAANIRVDARITFPDGNMIAITTDK